MADFSPRVLVFVLLLSLVAVGVPQPLFASLDDFPPPVSGLHFLGELSDLVLMFRIDDEDVVEAAEATLDIASDMALYKNDNI